MSTLIQNMRRNLIGSPIAKLLVALALVTPVAAWTHYQEQLALQPQSKLWVEGKSTIRSFSCKAEAVTAVVDASGTNAVVRVLTGDKAVQTVSVTVPSDKLDCGNGTMNEHMRKALKIEENPTISFRVTTYEMTKTANGVDGVLTGTLSLGGVTRTITVPAAGAAQAGALHVTGAYELAMSDYKLKAPSLMFGRIKVRDQVTVKFDLLLKS